MRGNYRVGQVGIIGGLTWMRGLRYVRKWDNTVAVFLRLSEGSPFESTPSKRDASPRMHRSAWQAKRVCNTDSGYMRLVVQDHTEEATMDHQPAGGAVVIDKAKVSELVHEMTDP
jgi:hypothetical protein